jgi:hypothetical protein
LHSEMVADEREGGAFVCSVAVVFVASSSSSQKDDENPYLLRERLGEKPRSFFRLAWCMYRHMLPEVRCYLLPGLPSGMVHWSLSTNDFPCV